MQFAGQQHRGGIPAVGMAFHGYVGQPNGMVNSEMTWPLSQFVPPILIDQDLRVRVNKLKRCKENSCNCMEIVDNVEIHSDFRENVERINVSSIYALSGLQKMQTYSPTSRKCRRPPQIETSIALVLLTGTISATLLFYFCAEMVPVREHECNKSFNLGRPPALS
ncbi:hypothetical protein Tco_0079852 [Tanacetum coccineum]